MTPLAILKTLWTAGTMRCVLLKQIEPPACAVQLYDGTFLVCTELVDGPEEAGEVAATLWGVFIDRTAQV
jgi:hypothetical protein